MKLLKLSLLLITALTTASSLNSQTTYTQGISPQLAKPSVINTAAGPISCTLTGDTFPAANITITCTFNSKPFINSTLPFPAGSAYTVQHNWTDPTTKVQSILTIIVNATTLPINITATINGGPAQGGNF